MRKRVLLTPALVAVTVLGLAPAGLASGFASAPSDPDKPVAAKGTRHLSREIPDANYGKLPSSPRPPAGLPKSPKPRQSPAKGPRHRLPGTATTVSRETESSRTVSRAATASKTLVLYDTSGSFGWLGELYGTGAANLATHFGEVTAAPVSTYTSGSLAQYDAVIYMGSTYNEALPAAFISDVITGTTPVIWSGFNIWQLGGTAGSAQATTFTQKYGWDPTTSYIDTADQIGSVEYKGQSLTRDGANNQGGVLAPHIVTPGAVTVVASAVCGDAAAPTACASIAQTTGTSFPWAIRSANLTYVGEIPFSFMSERDRYLAFADLLYPALNAAAPASRLAAVRLEDVSMDAEPATLRAYADYLSSQGVPFQVAVIPRYMDPRGVYNGGTPVNRPLAKTSAVVAALKYMQSKGGTVIHHGTTHQFGKLDNPYDGVSGNDFEFYRARCSTTTNPPHTYTPCTQSSSVQLLGPVGSDTVAGATKVVNSGRDIFTKAGLSKPTIFETPHYTASANAYRGIGAVYSTRYERALYFDGLLSGAPSGGRLFGQFFPYTVRDVYGSTVLPENLGNYEPDSYSGHPARLPADIVANAQANLVVTESTASFFFHPYYPLDKLKETVNGIKGLGYTFVTASSLK